jgi:hypothetical protein
MFDLVAKHALVVVAAIFEPMLRQGKPLLDHEREMA